MFLEVIIDIYVCQSTAYLRARSGRGGRRHMISSCTTLSIQTKHGGSHVAVSVSLDQVKTRIYWYRGQS